MVTAFSLLCNVTAIFHIQRQSLFLSPLTFLVPGLVTYLNQENVARVIFFVSKPTSQVLLLLPLLPLTLYLGCRVRMSVYPTEG